MSKTKKILLVEDDPFLIDIYNTKLINSGFKVTVAKEGESALRKIKKEKPDLILLDIVLPGMDGWEILKKIKEKEEFKKTKVAILSNLGQKEEVNKGLERGAIRYFIKAHYTPKEVTKKIKEILYE